MKRLAWFVFICFYFVPTILIAGQLDTERRIKDWGSFYSPDTKHVIIDSSYEYSWVRLGPRKTFWKLLTSRLMYFVKGHLPYVEFNHFDRDRRDDYTINFGSYFNFENSSFHFESGFGMNVDYIYRFQLTSDYTHRIYESLFGKIGGRYLEYESGDAFIASPGIVYYFGDHYLTADYNMVATEARRVAHSGLLRLNYAFIPNRLYAYSGGGIGQRLYDVYSLDSSKQGGFIVFSGLELRLLRDVKGRIGYSHSEERPNFIKKSLDFSMSLKF